MTIAKDIERREQGFYRRIVEEYLKHGSVDAVFRNNDYNLPISYPGVHRLIDRWGIVKTAGPNSKLSEVVTFMILLSDKKVPLERLYKDLPPSFRTSMATMHRVLHNIKEGVTRRAGTALVITSENDPSKILLAEDVSTPRLEMGKSFGSITLPMTFSKKDENPEVSILRVIQQEVLTNETLNKNVPDIIPNSPEPIMYLDIADVRVSVYNIILPSHFGESSFSSFKLRNFKYVEAEQVAMNGVPGVVRVGVREIAKGYLDFLERSEEVYTPTINTSDLNLALLEI